MFTLTDRVRYYRSVVRSLVSPLLPRLGVALASCTQQCALLLAHRADADPLKLISEVGKLEFSDPCDICIEESYAKSVDDLYVWMKTNFGALRVAVLKARNAIKDTFANQDARAQLEGIAARLGEIVDTVTLDDIVDFNFHYTARALYGDLGVERYMRDYALFSDAIGICRQIAGQYFVKCPALPERINATTAKQHLLAHADNAYSSLTTSGAPFPFWSEADGTGSLFGTNERTRNLVPVSGSGVDMSSPLLSLTTYLGLLGQFGTLADPNLQIWHDNVETNPMYAWFMASLIPAEEEMGALRLTYILFFCLYC
jgi:hypothetical protein